MRFSFISALILALAFPPLALRAEARGDVTVTRAWARATPQGANVGAAYLEIKAGGSAGDTLVSISSPVAARVELHSNVEENGIMKMRRLDALALGAGETRVLKPGGDHIMLLDLKGPLAAGDRLPLTLTFAKDGEVTVEATVEAIGSPGPGK